MTRGICKVCRGPAYVGLLSVECINPECAPFDPRSCVDVVSLPRPAVMPRVEGEFLPYRALEVALAERPESPERMYGVLSFDRDGYECVRPTREAVIDAWLVAHASMVADEPARRAVRALHRRMSEEQMQRVCIFNGCWVEDWNVLAWRCWEAMQ